MAAKHKSKMFKTTLKITDTKIDAKESLSAFNKLDGLYVASLIKEANRLGLEGIKIEKVIGITESKKEAKSNRTIDFICQEKEPEIAAVEPKAND